MSTFDQIVNAGKSFACSIYRNQPGALVPNPISDVLHLVWDNLCGDDPNGLPSPPTSPFEGGQCVDVAYVVHGDVIAGGTNSPTTSTVFGPVGGARAVLTPDGPVLVRATYQILCKGGKSPVTPSPQPYAWYTIGGTPSMPPDTRFVIVSIEREDGQPDTCGNPPSQFPPSPPPPVGGYTSPPVSITYNDGSDFTTVFNLNPPAGDSPPPPDICLSVIISGVEVKLCFPFGLPPSFGDDGGDVEDILNNIQDDIINIQNDVDNLQNDFNKFTDPPPPSSDPDLNETDSPDDEGGEQDDLPGLKWVLVRLTTLPVKSQFGTPSVNFAGWITFKIGDDYTDRVPIAFENGVFQAPSGATGYAITFTNMAKGISKAYTRDITP